MKVHSVLAGLLIGVAIVAATRGVAAAEGEGGAAERKAPLFEDLGKHRHATTLESPVAQRYFDQGLVLAYGFNHAEAGRSFREAARIEPDCAICWWGVGLVLGPNINAPMDPAAAPEAWGAVVRAKELAAGASEKERAYIDALAKRYAESPPADRAPLDAAYADAMREVARRYPDDLDAATLFAEALMDLSPWNYWAKDGKPREHTEEMLAAIESVLRRDPDHPGAIHFYIHAVEASDKPERAESYADRLGDLVPGAGHLVHMPAHIYMRVGRYHDAVLVNERATQADNSYVTQCRAQGFYPLVYVPHNHHFLWAATVMEGRRADALAAAEATDAKTQHQHMREPGLAALQHWTLTPLYTWVRFGMWKEVLDAEAPAEDLLYPTGIWRYARGFALARTGKVDEAAAELAELDRIAADEKLAGVKLFDVNSVTDILGVARATLAGELAAARGDIEGAAAKLREAVRRQEELTYTEPPDWYYPVRQSLGAVLLAAGRAAEAEAVYREDLAENRENGWSLFGLAKSLEAQAKKDEAAAVDRRFRKAWQYADVKLAASRF